MAGKGKAAVKELGENLIRMAQKGDVAGMKDILDNEEDTEFMVAAINFREQKVKSFTILKLKNSFKLSDYLFFLYM